jgi:FkbM family methyltransferase
MDHQFYRSSVLANRWLNKALRLLHARAPRRLWNAFGHPGPTSLQRFGSDYGGWFAPVERIGKDWIVYSFGVGQDTTFDEALIDRFGIQVHAFDPTNAAIEHIAQRRLSSAKAREKLLFEPVGLWDIDGPVRFFEPKTRGWVGSYSALNLQGTSKYVEVPCKALTTLMRERGHDHIDMLKMDIEGAEYRVLSSILDQHVRIRWLCVEFDQPVPLQTTRSMLRRLASEGFALRHVDRWNFVFENER